MVKRFTFFKMHGCSPCNDFNNGVWKELIELQKTKLKGIELSLIEFGNKDGITYELDKEYTYVVHAPYLCITEDKKLVKCYEGARNAKDLTAWILENIKPDTPVVKNPSGSTYCKRKLF